MQTSQPGTAKTAKSSLNTNEKVAAGKLVMHPKGSTEKKVKSRATSNNK